MGENHLFIYLFFWGGSFKASGLIHTGSNTCHATHKATKWSKVPIVCVTCCLACIVCTGLLLQQGHVTSSRVASRVASRSVCMGPQNKVLRENMEYTDWPAHLPTVICKLDPGKGQRSDPGSQFVRIQVQPLDKATGTSRLIRKKSYQVKGPFTPSFGIAVTLC